MRYERTGFLFVNDVVNRERKIKTIGNEKWISWRGDCGGGGELKVSQGKKINNKLHLCILTTMVVALHNRYNSHVCYRSYIFQIRCSSRGGGG